MASMAQAAGAIFHSCGQKAWLQSRLRVQADRQYNRSTVIKIAAILVLLMTSAQGAANLLWYRQPASNWNEAMPFGNGRLGGMVFGGAGEERIQLNEDTIWAGEKRDRNNPEAGRNLPEIRRLLFAGMPHEAEVLAEKNGDLHSEAASTLSTSGRFEIEVCGRSGDGLSPRTGP